MAKKNTQQNVKKKDTTIASVEAWIMTHARQIGTDVCGIGRQKGIINARKFENCEENREKDSEEMILTIKGSYMLQISTCRSHLPQGRLLARGGAD